MPPSTPKIGDRVSHEGLPAGYRITAIDARFDPDTGARFAIVSFENDRYAVKADAAELVWLEEDGAWHLPGRLLSQAERDLWAVTWGGPNRNRPQDHVTARKALLAEHPVRMAEIRAELEERAARG